MPTAPPKTVTPAPTTSELPVKRTRKYSGPPKGSEEAKERMKAVRAAQYAKNGLVYKE